VTPRSFASSEFWDQYHALSEEIRTRADKQFELFSRDPQHPSLHLKPVGTFWSVRVTLSHRALAVRRGDSFFWFWIGPHDKYERLFQ
jgi:hypothetical protein